MDLDLTLSHAAKPHWNPVGTDLVQPAEPVTVTLRNAAPEHVAATLRAAADSVWVASHQGIAGIDGDKLR